MIKVFVTSSSVVFVALFRNSEPAVLFLANLKNIEKHWKTQLIGFGFRISYAFVMLQPSICRFFTSSMSLSWASNSFAKYLMTVKYCEYERIDRLNTMKPWDFWAFWAEIGIFISSSSLGFTDAALCSYIQSSLGDCRKWLPSTERPKLSCFSKPNSSFGFTERRQQ